MPWWALILVVAWLALGIVQVLVWQQRGDGVYILVLRLITGIIFIPAFLAVLIFWDIQSKMELRRKRRGSSKIPVVH